mgnify:CR=1 FL=1
MNREAIPTERKLLESKLTEAGHIALAIQKAGGKALVVGGFARDEVMRRLGMTTGDSKDVDIEVYGIPFPLLQESLAPFGNLNLVGESFGVIKLGDFDISIPRRDSKTGKGHKGFSIEGDPHMMPREAAKRRDLTINSIAIDPLTGDIVDEYGGVEDLKNKLLRATDLELFGDDPLRVLRLMQFAGRFGFGVEEQTMALAKSLPIEELPAERITEEWRKLLLKSERPSMGLEVACQLDIIKKLHPELHALIGIPQEPEWHPEGDVWTHTCMVIDVAAEIIRRENLSEEEALVVMVAALCHDLGKATSTEYKANKQGDMAWRAHEHSEAGIEPAKQFLGRMMFGKDLNDKIAPLIREHLFPSQNPEASEASVRRLSHRLAPATIQELVMVGESDQMGRGTPRRKYTEGTTLLATAAKLGIKEGQPERILMGRHLIEMGMKPGPGFKKILDQVFEAQLEGKVVSVEEAKTMAQTFQS